MVTGTWYLQHFDGQNVWALEWESSDGIPHSWDAILGCHICMCLRWHRQQFLPKSMPLILTSYLNCVRSGILISDPRDLCHHPCRVLLVHITRADMEMPKLYTGPRGIIAWWWGSMTSWVSPHAFAHGCSFLWGGRLACFLLHPETHGCAWCSGSSVLEQ